MTSDAVAGPAETSGGPVSWWTADAGIASASPPLAGAVDADVAILGAGFTGLWTAYALQQVAPDLRVVILEAAHIGYGASGRNGGWCTAGLSVTYGELARRHGRDVARRTALAMQDTVVRITETCEEEGIDAHVRPSGVLRIARGAHEVAAMRAGWQTRVDLGLEAGCVLLGPAGLADRVVVDDARGAVFDPHGATVHPGRLVRGLAELVQQRGAVIHERTPVTSVRPGGSGRRPVLRTASGDVTADTVVLAGEAFLSQLPRMRRVVLPVYSLIVLTEPLDDGQWASIGWEGGECLSSHRYTVDYLARTDDGRVLFGGRGAPYHYGSGIDPAYDRHAATHSGLRRQLLEWFPSLGGIRFTAAWGGAVGLSRDWMPTVAWDPFTGVAAAHGYGGQGVATANLAGRILAARITGSSAEVDGVGDLTDLPVVDHRPRRWEPEPVRWAAVRYLQGAMGRLDARAARTGRPPTGRSLAERLTRH